MNLEQRAKRAPEWWGDTSSDIPLFTRAKLVRNLKGYNFPPKASDDELEEVREIITYAIERNEKLQGFTIFKGEELTPEDRNFLWERFLISKTFIDSPKGKLVAISPDEDISIVVNDRDHLVIQSFANGLNIREAYNKANEIAKILGLEYTYSEEWGHLTSSPLEVGTGLRVAITLHLPALVLLRQYNFTVETLTPQGFIFHNLWGTGTTGYIFVVTNALTWAFREEIITPFEYLANALIKQENKAREVMNTHLADILEDKVTRSWGLLKYARLLSEEETWTYISGIRMGISMGLIFSAKELPRFTNLLLITRHSHLEKRTGRKLQQHIAEKERAALVRSFINGMEASS